VFGPDGYLYIGLGDGGSGGDPERYALDASSRLGKLLRIDPTATAGAPFTVPDDNPFVGVDGADPTIWSIGLRNPWRFAFDEPTGDLWIADVGQNEVEEVNRSVPSTDGSGAGRGVSYGWSAFEGNDRFNDDESGDGHEPPVVTYRHEDGNCSVGGGAVYRGTAIPDLRGWYVYGDYCSGRIWGYDPTSSPESPVIVELGSLGTLSAISPDASGELIAVANDGTLARLT
jgi:glucose/arabinose dehydrogenase